MVGDVPSMLSDRRSAWQGTANPYALAGDEARIAISQQFGLSVATSNRYRGKGWPQWEAFMRSRGWLPQPPFTTLFLDKGDRSYRLSDQQRTELVILFTVYLREQGLEPYDYVLALRKEFERVGANVSIFDAEAVMVAKSRQVPYLARDRATTKRANERQTVTALMLKRCYDEDIVPLPALCECPVDLVDYFGAVCIGFCIYNFGKRVGQFAKTTTDDAALEPSRAIEAMVRGLASLSSSSSSSSSSASKLEFPSQSVDSRLLVDAHCIRAMDVIFTCKRRFEFVSVSADALRQSELLESSIPLEVSLTFYTSKADQNGERPENYVVETVSSPAEAALVRMLWKWAWFAQYEHPLDMFFSRPGIGVLGSAGRKRLRRDSVNNVAKFCAVSEGLVPSGFSTNSFKVGGYSRQLREEGQELGAEPNAVLIQRRLTGYFGHRSVKAAKHYQRPSARTDGPLSSVWLDAERDALDHRDLVDRMKLGSGVKPDSEMEKLSVVTANKLRVKGRNQFLRRRGIPVPTVPKRARLATARLSGVDTDPVR